ncbi:MAG: extracellular solute-binding protein [Hyphomicrobiaceae bacterium]
MHTRSRIPLLRKGVDRREFLKAAGALGLGFTMMPMMHRPARAEGEATYFTWGGYDIPELQTKYKAKYGADPQFATYGDTEEGLQKMLAGFVPDVMHPCSGEVPRWKNAGVLQPIDTSKLSNYEKLLPELKNLPAANIDGQVWMVPWEWGFTSITYRTDLVKLPNGEESWEILWDEANKGKIAVIGSADDSWWVGAIYAGVPFDTVATDDAAYQKVNDLLKKQRPLIRLYTSNNTEQQQALASGEIVAAMTWADAATNLLKEGVPVKFAQPKEGTLTWVCGLVLNKSAPNLDKAYALIDGMLDPEIGKYCIDNFGYGHSNPASYEGVDQAQLAALGMDKGPEETLKGGHFYIPQPDSFSEKLYKDWEQIKGGL